MLFYFDSSTSSINVQILFLNCAPLWVALLKPSILRKPYHSYIFKNFQCCGTQCFTILVEVQVFSQLRHPTGALLKSLNLRKLRKNTFTV